MKTIPCRNSDKLILIDDEEYERLSKRTWFTNDRSSRVFTAVGHSSISISCFVMRQIDLFDHKDKNPFNNQKSNLRSASVSKNNCNKGKRADSKQKFKGIMFDKHCKLKYRAIIHYKNQWINLGRYSHPEDAAIAYDRKAKELYGEFACLNFPEA